MSLLLLQLCKSVVASAVCVCCCFSCVSLLLLLLSVLMWKCFPGHQKTGSNGIAKVGNSVDGELGYVTIQRSVHMVLTADLYD